jgi:hypothetical protein
VPSIKLDKRTQSWLKQGRGTGTGKEYKPWLTIRDLPSEGRSHRIYGFKTQRTHHLLSDLELAAFYLLELHPAVIDVREQYPLNLDDTLKIAKNCGIQHPTKNGFIHVMSSDFLIDLNDFPQKQIAFQVKYISDLKDNRTIEKLEIERSYWKKISIPLYLLTDQNIPKLIIENLKWMYSARCVGDDIHRFVEQLPLYSAFFNHNPDDRISQVAMKIDNAYSFEPGESLRTIRSLLAYRLLKFDLRKEWSQILVSEISVSSEMSVIRTCYAAN